MRDSCYSFGNRHGLHREVEMTRLAETLTITVYLHLAVPWGIAGSTTPQCGGDGMRSGEDMQGRSSLSPTTARSLEEEAAHHSAAYVQCLYV